MASSDIHSDLYQYTALITKHSRQLLSQFLVHWQFLIWVCIDPITYSRPQLARMAPRGPGRRRSSTRSLCVTPLASLPRCHQMHHSSRSSSPGASRSSSTSSLKAVHMLLTTHCHIYVLLSEMCKHNVTHISIYSNSSQRWCQIQCWISVHPDEIIQMPSSRCTCFGCSNLLLHPSSPLRCLSLHA